MTTVSAYHTRDKKCQFEPTKIERREPGPTEIFFEIAYAGICHSDIHTAKQEWGPALYPLVPGHEIAGTVTKIGSEVTRFQVGDRVGVGCFVDSCGECDNCRDGWENFCTSHDKPTVFTYNDVGRDGEPTRGGYSRGFTVEQNYACTIPDAIELKHAAPLMCAGITLYSPLKRWGAAPGKKVAIVGMGGLGHMGVQIAAAMGAETSVISRTMNKEADGRKLGASHYYATENSEQMRELRGTFDLLISTVSDGIDVNFLLSLVKKQGVVVLVGLPEKPTELALAPLVTGQKILAGSNIGGIALTQEMLEFCATHNLRPMIEVISGDQITEAYQNVVEAKVRYRYVIDTSTFDQ